MGSSPRLGLAARAALDGSDDIDEPIRSVVLT
jgi:hypothetical protein